MCPRRRRLRKVPGRFTLEIGGGEADNLFRKPHEEAITYFGRKEPYQVRQVRRVILKYRLEEPD